MALLKSVSLLGNFRKFNFLGKGKDVAMLFYHNQIMATPKDHGKRHIGQCTTALST